MSRANRRARTSLLAASIMCAIAALGSAGPPSAPWPALARYEAMAIPADNPMTTEKVALGRQLFFDPRLSGDGGTACASCHRPENGFTQGRAAGGRACPTLWNVGYLDKLFWDGTATALERAAAGMWRFALAPGKAGQPGTAEVAARLAAIDGYRSQFRAVFAEDPTTENVPKALAAFLRTLVTTRARSRWLRFREGDPKGLSPAARRGFEVFDGKAGCTNCHNGVLLTDQQFHNVGIGMSAAKPDLGRGHIVREDRYRGAFKTPTLLDIPRTGPYFHDGSVATLEEAVDVMAGGGLANPSLDAALRPVTLSPDERASLIAFLRELAVDDTPAAPELPR
jgi:cytochrome c peroxidase